MDNLLKGLTILKPYYESSKFKISAKHDAIYAFPTDREIPKPLVKAMIESDWHQEYDSLDHNSDFEVGDYKKDEFWIYYI